MENDFPCLLILNIEWVRFDGLVNRHKRLPPLLLPHTDKGIHEVKFDGLHRGVITVLGASEAKSYTVGIVFGLVPEPVAGV